MVFPSSQIFNGGQMTDLPEYTGAYDPTILLECVAPGNVEEGVNYAISLALVASFVVAALEGPTIITSGATLASPYVAVPSDKRLLFNKTVGAASYTQIGAGSSRLTPLMIRDLKGDADIHPITILFSGSADGHTSPIVIDTPYAGWIFNPLASGNWYLTNT